MATRDKRRYQRDPSEAQLRVMLEARQHELEAQRQRTSCTFSWILIGVVCLVGGAIWLFPAAPVVTDHPAAAVSLARNVRQAANLKSTAASAASTDSTEDVRFAMQLLNFVNPTAPPAANAESAAKTLSESAIKSATAMP
ncbi:MAG: hypothetical protein V4640_07060 [Verrucomicrobiota bacterium]